MNRAMIIGSTPRDIKSARSIHDGSKIIYAVDHVLPENKSPSKKDIREGRLRVKQEIATFKPRVVLLLGNTPLISITGNAGIKQKRGKPFEQDGVIYLPTYHPSFVSRDERNRPNYETDIRAFKAIIDRGQVPREEGLNWTIVDNEFKFKSMIKDLRGTVSFDCETSGLYPWADDAAVMSIGFGTKKHQWCLPLMHPESPWKPKQIIRMIRRVDVALQKCSLVAHNGKFDTLWMKVHYGYTWHCDFDTMLAHYMLDENRRHGLKQLAQEYYGAPDYEIDKDEKKGAGPIFKHCLYLAHDVFYTRNLRFTFGKLLKKDSGTYQVWEHITMPCSRMFVEIEYNGIFIDLKRMEEVEQHLNKQIVDAERVLKKYGNINWGSTKQLRKLLFEDLKIEPLDLTKTGLPSTSESVLLRIDHPLVDSLLNWRKAKKNLSTFINGWKPYTDKDGYLHPSFKLHGTVTGRPSCEHPNLQQVPRDPVIRSLLTAPLGWVLLEGDLSQAELRVVAELSGDRELVYAYKHDLDVHWRTALREVGRAGAYPRKVRKTAYQYLGRKVEYPEALESLMRMGPDVAVEIDKFWKDIRKKAKATNFGYVYGMWWKKFKIYARDNYGINLTDQECQESRKAFFELYKGLVPWHARQKRFVRRNGYVRALSGRLRRLPAAQLPYDCFERGEAERQGINSPVQGFTSDINLMAALELYEMFGPDIIRICGTVHDAILVRAREDKVEEVHDSLLRIMSRPSRFTDLDITMSVPLKGEVKIGPWSKGVSLRKWKS